MDQNVGECSAERRTISKVNGLRLAGRFFVSTSTVLGLVVGLAGPAQAFNPLVIPGVSAEQESTVGLLGSRPGATALPIPVSDQVSASLDVGTGNLLVSINALSLPGISGNAGLGVTHNSLSAETAPISGHPGWSLTLGPAGSLATTNDGVLFTGGDGYSALFTPVQGSATAFTPPAGVKADLVKTSSGYTLTSRTTAQVLTFDEDGKTVTFADRNANASTIGYSGSLPTQVTSTRGPAGARTADLDYDTAGILAGFSQTSGTATRGVSFDSEPSTGDLALFTDLAGNETEFIYTDHLIEEISSPAGGRILFTYDDQGRVTSIEQENTSTRSPGNSLTRVSYPSDTQTLIAGPNTNPSVAIDAGPRTAYTLNGLDLVESVIDPEGRQQSATYTADFDTLTSTQGTGTSAGTTTNTYGANTGQSVTASASPGGAAGQAEYANTAANTAYLTTSTTDDAGNQSLYTYNGAGNALTSTDALAAESALTYNTDGTVATALAPGNGTNSTNYGYDANHQLVSLTPVAGSSLASRAFTYDAWGRTKTTTDGRGTTLTYTYDAIGRLLTTAFSDGTPTVTNTYNGIGQALSRVDGSGTTAYGYDQMGRLTSRSHTASGGTISYGYDKASNLTSTTDSRGTTEYTFDDSGVPETLIYLIGGVQKTLAFATDDRGRRTDTWLQASPSRTQWKAHTRTEYDNTGRITRVVARSGEGDTDNTPVMDLIYCYTAGSTAPTCPNTDPASDRSKIQWVTDNLTGAVTNYTYDGSGRLTDAVVTGGEKRVSDGVCK